MFKKYFVAFFHPLYWGIKAHGNLNAGNFSIHWNALPVLFYYFSPVFIFLTNISKPPCPYPRQEVFFVEAGPQHMVPNVGQEGNPKTHKSVARCTREYVEGPHKKNYTVSGEVSNEHSKINNR